MRVNKRKCLTICSVCVILWIVYVIFSGLKHKSIKDDGNIEDIVKVFPQHILTAVKKDSSHFAVVVVEEHHEVIPYWFAVAESGIISKNGVTLFHVDGHADTGYPEIIDNFPLFQWPKSISQIFSLMQKNDVFVMGATITGMINRFIWVWPPWDKVNHKLEHKVIFMNIGYTVRSHNGQSVSVLCFCGVSTEFQTDCFMSNSIYIDNESDMTSILQSECSFIQNASLIYEEVSEQEAIRLIQSDDHWIDSSEELILDIDEDYYGCESVASKFYNTGIKYDFINNLAIIINSMFCGYSVQDEIIADNFFNNLIKMISDLKTNMTECKISTKKSCLTRIRIQQILFQMIPSVIENLKNKGSVLCSSTDKMNYIYLQGLMRNMLQLTTPVLNILSNIGICLPASPKTLNYEPEMRLCLSYNAPNSTLVLFHTPTQTEIEKRTTNLQTLFSQHAFIPKLITITRSVRDGYTPRDKSFKIESDLMRVLHNSFVGFDRHLVYFDDCLLGKKQGWHGRHSL